MKKVFVVIVALFFTVYTYAQDNVTPEDPIKRSHEVKINGLSIVVGAADVTYEYLLNEESGVGLTLFVPITNNLSDDLNFYVSPYYRFYFGEEYAAGFFLEGFGMLSSTNNVVRRAGFAFPGPVEEVTEEGLIDFALGIGLGGKWVTDSGFVGELSLGVGRNLFNSDETDEDFVGKIGITLGYRF